MRSSVTSGGKDAHTALGVRIFTVASQIFRSVAVCNKFYRVMAQFLLRDIFSRASGAFITDRPQPTRRFVATTRWLMPLRLKHPLQNTIIFLQNTYFSHVYLFARDISSFPRLMLTDDLAKNSNTLVLIAGLTLKHILPIRVLGDSFLTLGW